MCQFNLKQKIMVDSDNLTFPQAFVHPDLRYFFRLNSSPHFAASWKMDFNVLAYKYEIFYFLESDKTVWVPSSIRNPLPGTKALLPVFPPLQWKCRNLTELLLLAPKESSRAANQGSKPFVVCNCNFRLMTDYRPDWVSALQKGREGHWEQDPDLYECSTCSGLEAEAARVSEAWPAVWR